MVALPQFLKCKWLHQIIVAVGHETPQISCNASPPRGYPLVLLVSERAGCPPQVVNLAWMSPWHPLEGTADHPPIFTNVSTEGL
jgi:hypothetical protein